MKHREGSSKKAWIGHFNSVGCVKIFIGNWMSKWRVNYWHSWITCLLPSERYCRGATFQWSHWACRDIPLHESMLKINEQIKFRIQTNINDSNSIVAYVNMAIAYKHMDDVSLYTKVITLSSTPQGVYFGEILRFLGVLWGTNICEFFFF